MSFQSVLMFHNSVQLNFRKTNGQIWKNVLENMYSQHLSRLNSYTWTLIVPPKHFSSLTHLHGFIVWMVLIFKIHFWTTLLAHLAFRPGELLPSFFVCPSTFHILIFSSETTGPIATKLWWNGPRMAPFQKCVRWSQFPTKMSAKLKIEKKGMKF